MSLTAKSTEAKVAFPQIYNEVPGAPPALEHDLTRLNSEFQKNDYLNLEQGLIHTIGWQREPYAEEAHNDG